MWIASLITGDMIQPMGMKVIARNETWQGLADMILVQMDVIAALKEVGDDSFNSLEIVWRDYEMSQV